MKMDIQAKRVYESAAKEDGTRVLVDRLWPRGMTKEKLKADLWLKDAAPETQLRKWFNHDPARWDEFKKRYFAQLDENPEIVRQLREVAGRGRLSLLYSAHDTQRNQAEVLKEYLLSKR